MLKNYICTVQHQNKETHWDTVLKIRKLLRISPRYLTLILPSIIAVTEETMRKRYEITENWQQMCQYYSRIASCTSRYKENIWRYIEDCWENLWIFTQDSNSCSSRDEESAEKEELEEAGTAGSHLGLKHHHMCMASLMFSAFYIW